jgi:hypothetical protein
MLKGSMTSPSEQATQALAPAAIPTLIDQYFGLGELPSDRKLREEMRSWVGKYAPQLHHTRNSTVLVLRACNDHGQMLNYIIRYHRHEKGSAVIRRYYTLGMLGRPDIGKLEASTHKLRDFSGKADNSTQSENRKFNGQKANLAQLQTTRDYRQLLARLEFDFIQRFRPKLLAREQDPPRKAAMNAKIAGFIRAAIHRPFGQAIRAFVAELDQPTVQTLTQLRWPDPAAYNWLMAGKTPQAQLYRRQAASALPILLPSVAQNEEAAEALGKKIDAGEPWHELAREWFLPAAKTVAPVRWLFGVTPAQMGRKLFAKGTGSIQLMPELDKVWVPQDPAGWNGFCGLSDASRQFSALCGKAPGQIIREAQGNWAGHNAAIATFRESGTVDYFRTIYVRLILPGICQQWGQDQPDELYREFAQTRPYERDDGLNNSRAPSVLLRQLWQNATVPQIARFNKQWHDDIARYNTREIRAGAGSGSGRGWPALTQVVTAPNGVKVTPLTSAAALEHEGREMHHCVSGYWRSCINGHTAIISLHDPTDDSRSTLELSLLTDEKTVWRRQHTRQRNLAPSSACDAAAKWYTEAINKKQLDANWQDISRAAEIYKREEGRDLLQGVVGYDPYDTEKHNALFEVFHRIVPVGAGARNVTHWLSRTGLDRAIETEVKSRQQAVRLI